MVPFLCSTVPALGIPGLQVKILHIFNKQYSKPKNYTKRLFKSNYLGTIFNKHTFFLLLFDGKIIFALLFIQFHKPFTAYLSLAVRLPITSGLIIATLTSGDLGPRDLVCDILRDLTVLSMVTTSNWAIITIMFR